MPQFRVRNTFTRPNTGVEWPFKRADLEGTPWRTQEDGWFNWMQTNRSETVEAVWDPNELQVHVDVMFADQATFSACLVEMQEAGVGNQFNTDSWENIETTDGYTHSITTGYV